MERKWYRGVLVNPVNEDAERGVELTAHGFGLPAMGTLDGEAWLYDPATGPRRVHVDTLAVIERPATARVVTVLASRDDYATVRQWMRVLGEELCSFSAVIMPDGERRYFASRFNGYGGGPNFACAWTQCLAVTIPAPERPECPTCDGVHDVIGTCATCTHLVTRNCQGDVLHVDYTDVFTAKHGDHAPDWEKRTGVLPA